MPLPRDFVALVPEQFDKLVELLTPGYELALAYKAQMAQPQPDTPPVDDAPSADDASKQGSG